MGEPDPVIKKLLSSYRRTLGRQHHPIEEFRYVHTAYKMVGVGSVGTRCYIMLLVGRDHNDPLFLQVKEAQASVLERFLGTSTYPHHGQRVVAGQRLMQAATDIFLGWQRIKGLDGVTRDYYVRQFHDWKGSADVDSMLVSGATLYSRLCGATLARAHARWGDRIAIASYLGKGTPSTRRSPISRPPTPIRTNGTTKRSLLPSTPDGWLPKPAYERARSSSRRRTQVLGDVLKGSRSNRDGTTERILQQEDQYQGGTYQDGHTRHHDVVQLRALDTEKQTEPERDDAGQKGGQPQNRRYRLTRELQTLLPLLAGLDDLSQHVAQEGFLRRSIRVEALNRSDQLIEVLLRDRARPALGHCRPLHGGHRGRILRHQLPDVCLCGRPEGAAELHGVPEAYGFVLHGIAGRDVLLPQGDDHEPSDDRIDDTSYRAQESGCVIVSSFGQAGGSPPDQPLDRNRQRRERDDGNDHQPPGRYALYNPPGHGAVVSLPLRVGLPRSGSQPVSFSG